MTPMPTYLVLGIPFILFSVIMWIKGFIWLKYHLHFNVKVRQKVKAERVYEVFKWNFAIPYFIWAATVAVTCCFNFQYEDIVFYLVGLHGAIMFYILVIKELLTLFGWRLGEWNTQVPHISFFQRKRLHLIEEF